MNSFQMLIKNILSSAATVCILVFVPTAVAQDRTSEDEEPTPVFISDSNTGYIDNAIIKTRSRIRFDLASDMDSPDRAEFFYGACGCARVVPDPPSNTPAADGAVLNADAPGPVGTVIPGAILSSPLIETSIDYQELRFDYEYAFNPGFSLFIEVPLRFIDGEVIGKEEGLGDIRAGFKWGLIRSESTQLTFQLRAYFPTGEPEEGLGTDHASVEPGLLYFGRLDEHWTLAAELRYWIPLDGTSGRNTGFTEDYYGDVVRYGFGIGYDMDSFSSVRVTPVLEIVGWSVLGGLAISSPSSTPMTAQYREVEDDQITNVKLGARITFDKKSSVYLGFGKAVTGDVWYDDVFRMEYRTIY